MRASWLSEVSPLQNLFARSFCGENFLIKALQNETHSISSNYTWKVTFVHCVVFSFASGLFRDGLSSEPEYVERKSFMFSWLRIAHNKLERNEIFPQYWSLPHQQLWFSASYIAGLFLLPNFQLCIAGFGFVCS